MTPANARTIFRRALQGSPFEWLVSKVLRKTMATELKRVAGIQDASTHLGHSSITTTEQYYIEQVHDAPDNADLIDDMMRRTGI